MSVCYRYLIGFYYYYFFLEGRPSWHPKMYPILYEKEVKFPPSLSPCISISLLYRSSVLLNKHLWLHLSTLPSYLRSHRLLSSTCQTLPALINLCPEGLYKSPRGKSHLSLLLPQMPAFCCQSFPFPQIITHTRLENKNNIYTKKNVHKNIRKNETKPTGPRLW